MFSIFFLLWLQICVEISSRKKNVFLTKSIIIKQFTRELIFVNLFVGKEILKLAQVFVLHRH